MNQGGRVVTVASTAHTFGDIDFDDLNYTSTERKYTPWGAYGQSKLANILFAKGLDDRLKAAGSDVLSVSLYPGVIKTNLWRYSNPLFQVFMNVIADKMLNKVLRQIRIVLLWSHLLLMGVSIVWIVMEDEDETARQAMNLDTFDLSDESACIKSSQTNKISSPQTQTTTIHTTKSGSKPTPSRSDVQHANVVHFPAVSRDVQQHPPTLTDELATIQGDIGVATAGSRFPTCPSSTLMKEGSPTSVVGELRRSGPV